MNDFFQKLFVKKTGNFWVQFFRYFFSGGAAFVVYFVLLLVLTEYLHVFHLTSLLIAYSLSIVVNFLVSKYFVFSQHDQRSSRQFVKFFVVALIGLCLQYLFVSFFTGSFAIQYLIANVIASALVYVVSFSLNRTFTFVHKP
jgi:putative flippase GtrA